MKTKLLLATEEESSITTRITPKDLGYLLSKSNTNQISEILGQVQEQSYCITEEEYCSWLEAIAEEVKGLLQPLNASSCSPSVDSLYEKVVAIMEEGRTYTLHYLKEGRSYSFYQCALWYEDCSLIYKGDNTPLKPEDIDELSHIWMQETPEGSLVCVRHHKGDTIESVSDWYKEVTEECEISFSF